MTDQFIGEIRIFAGTVTPRGWALCNGQLLPLQQNAALFSILGTNYGGNGINTFALPDLRGRAPMNAGQGTGLTPRVVGAQAGQEAVTLTTAQLPAHNHGTLAADTQTTDKPNGAAPAPGGSYGPGTTAMAPTAVSGQGMGHNNVQPSLALNFMIATAGIFPSRG